MKNRVFAVALVVCLCVISLSGCQLAQSDSGEVLGKDRLIGIFVTTEYLDLFDMEGYLNNNLPNINGGEIKVDDNQEKYNGRIYAILKEDEIIDRSSGERSIIKEYVFEDTFGFTLYAATIKEDGESYISSGSNVGFADVKTHIKSGDAVDEISLSGTLFITPFIKESVFYANPIYQSNDGSVYAISGQGISSSGAQDEGSNMSTKLTDSITTTLNGKSTTFTSDVELNITIMFPPKKVTVIEIDKNSEILSKRTLSLNNLPSEFKTSTNAEYVIVETVKTDLDGKDFLSAETFDKKDEVLYVFVGKENEICEKTQIELLWD